MANSRTAMIHNNVVYRAMDCQCIAHQRIEGDSQEHLVLVELAGLVSFVPGEIGVKIRRRVKWLLNYDAGENSDHSETLAAAKDVCRLLEKAKPAALPSKPVAG